MLIATILNFLPKFLVIRNIDKIKLIANALEVKIIDLISEEEMEQLLKDPSATTVGPKAESTVAKISLVVVLP